MEIASGTTLHGFTISKKTDLPEIDGEAIEGIHDASGARLLFLKNDDTNKSFAIGFRTPPQDDTGVFHILEHSVLCGSRRFPVKEPFVDLLKGSMQTFLNAMTFGDKTLYPVASTNEQDLFNLMDVYLDAVFHPNIYVKRAIFEQEGWHYELMANDASSGADPASLGADETTLVHNGVVFNEMKGALSDANSVLYDRVQTALFPDNCYAFESGGTPQAIPTLTYENYLDEHRRHYRTDNSYIVLYGDLDIDRALAFLDERYLTPVAAEQAQADEQRASNGLDPLVPRTIELQKPVAPGYLRTTMDTAPETACAACGYVIGTSKDCTRTTATEILLDALLGSNEAPLKRALLEAGVAHDVHAFVSDALLQPFAIVQLQMPAEGAAEKLADTLSSEVRKLIDEGLDLDLVEAALSHEEFQMREHDMGIADGVVNAMISLSGWLYDDEAATDYLRYDRIYSELREKLDKGYFEDLAISLFCENEHFASVEVVPTPGQSDDDSAEKLAEMNRSLSADERAHIVAEEATLRELQESPDSPEALATLPRLHVSDIGEAPAEPPFQVVDDAPIACLRHSVHTNDIAYAYQYFDMDVISFEELPYTTILANVLGKLDTAHHTAAEIDTLVQGKLGNLTFFTDVFGDDNDITSATPRFGVSASSLSDNVEWLADLPREVLTETDFTNVEKILNVLQQRKIGMEQSFTNAGHSCATARVKSYYTKVGVAREQLGNVGFYRFLCDLLDHFEERAADLVERLQDIARRLFCDDKCLVSFTGTDEDYTRYWAANPGCGQASGNARILQIPEPQMRNEAFVTPSDVCYAALGWDRRLSGGEFCGAWLVASRAISYDYLWNEVRVKGGAYGTGFQAIRAGNMRFYSYRDPHLDETVERFEKTSDWLAGFQPEQDALEGFVIATVASLDAPKKPRLLIRRQLSDYLTGYSAEQRLEVRRQVIHTSAEDVRELAGVLRAAIEPHALCVFGNRAILEGSSLDLEVIPLVG